MCGTKSKTITLVLMSSLLVGAVSGSGVFLWKNAETQTIKNNLESEMVSVYERLGDVLANSSYCADSEEKMRETYNSMPSAQDMIFEFLNGSNWQDLQEEGEILNTEICYDPDLDKISFILYVSGNEEYNNIIGTYDNQQNFVTDKKYNKRSGDIGVCTIDGYFGGDLVYSCNGGDGPFGWETVYVLKGTGESTLIKDCVFNSVYSDENGENEAVEECTVNL